MNFHVLTLFPEMITQGLSNSIIGKASENGLLQIEAINIRDYTLDKHKKVDDYPYGGGAGMLMQAQPVYDAWQSVAKKCEKKPRTVYLTPQGHTFTQPMARELALEEDLILLCGHYEGIDERVLEEIVTDYVSIGDYVLTGGELPAMVMIDAISRMVPGVLNNSESGETESFEGNLLEYPQYSRPEEWNGKKVPAVLLSGNQKNIRAWRKEEAIKRTKERRPDMYKKYAKLAECKEIMQKQKLLHMDMIELIERGQAELVYKKEATIVLYDKNSGIYFHTTNKEEEGIAALKKILFHRNEASGFSYVALHQEYMVKHGEILLQTETSMKCKQAVYTRKEKLPITGLYSLDEKKNPALPVIRKLSIDLFATVAEHYEGVDDLSYVKERMEKGCLFGAFAEGKLAGFIGTHAEGTIGLLKVFPEYRGRKIGKALETYMINQTLELGQTPFGQVVEGNEVSMALQQSLGLCFSKDSIFWMKRVEKL